MQVPAGKVLGLTSDVIMDVGWDFQNHLRDSAAQIVLTSGGASRKLAVRIRPLTSVCSLVPMSVGRFFCCWWFQFKVTCITQGPFLLLIERYVLSRVCKSGPDPMSAEIHGSIFIVSQTLEDWSKIWRDL